MEPRNHFATKARDERRRERRAVANLCVNCRERWSQSKLGLCRRCERQVLGVMNAQKLLEQEQSAESYAQEQKRLKLAPLEPFREVIDDGRVFVIVWPRYRLGELPARPS